MTHPPTLTPVEIALLFLHALSLTYWLASVNLNFLSFRVSCAGWMNVCITYEYTVQDVENEQLLDTYVPLRNREEWDRVTASTNIQ